MKVFNNELNEKIDFNSKYKCAFELGKKNI